ncbi:hypothetical protein F3Y22_tig00110317pilonHSYRG00041 [Hibiscus syriacus]|uniref:RNase H type-1 domain-containing protein n=1 Tax=Hibiscus syriacus TaxID=106335 RepID=A0A6A3B1Z7_HIBSY|nr:hypothetical protein F3Y22_tig00110317pilonHSYRG00041 [Hibiscus syriacus]
MTWNIWNRRNKLLREKTLLNEQSVINSSMEFKNVGREAAIGIVACDHHGFVVGGVARKVASPQNAESAEAMTFSLGIQFACEQGWDRVIIEGDAFSIINRINIQHDDLTVVGLSLRETKAVLDIHPNFKVCYTNRLANRVAHSLAQWALSIDNLVWFYFDEPNCIRSDVILDAIGI